MRAHGFSIVETMVVVAITGILAAATVPELMGYLASHQVKGVSDEFLTGLRKAKAEAIRRNATVTFRSTGGLWRILDANQNVLLEGAGSVGTSRGPVRVTPMAAVITFDSRGRATPEMTFEMSPTATTCEAATCYNIRVFAGGGTKLCNPKATDMRAC